MRKVRVRAWLEGPALSVSLSLSALVLSVEYRLRDEYVHCIMGYILSLCLSFYISFTARCIFISVVRPSMNDSCHEWSHHSNGERR